MSNPIQKAVGALMWAATMTRPDLLFAAQNLAKFYDDPGPVHWKAAVEALRYFWQTKNLDITNGGVTSRGLAMSAYVDSDHATCPDSRRSVSGGAVMLGGGYDNLVLTRTEDNSVGVIRVGVCGACGNRE